MNIKEQAIREQQLIYDSEIRGWNSALKETIKKFEYCGRSWGVVNCDKNTPCFICKRTIKDIEGLLKK